MPEERTEKRTVTVRCQFCLTWNMVDAARTSQGPRCGKCQKPILLDRPLVLDDETFDRTIAGSQVPVFVDFYADWCAPCKMMAPFVDQLAAKYHGQAIVAKLNTDKSAKAAMPFRIAGIPTSIVFESGREVARQTGAVQLAGLEALLNKAVSGEHLQG